MCVFPAFFFFFNNISGLKVNPVIGRLALLCSGIGTMRLTRPCLLALAFRSHSRGHKVNPCSLLLSGTIRLTRSCLLVRLLPVLLGTALSRFLKVMRSFLLDRLLDELAHENTTRNKQFKQFIQLIAHASIILCTRKDTGSQQTRWGARAPQRLVQSL